MEGLTPDTLYHFRVKCSDASGNQAVSDDDTFFIDTTAPVITNILVSNISAISAVITWTTDEPADSTVYYGIAGTGSIQKTDSNLVTNHTVTLSGIEPNSTYHFYVRSTDASGNQSISEDDTFTTLEPDITPLIIPWPLVGCANLESTIIRSQSDLDNFISDIQQQDDWYGKAEFLQNVAAWQIDFSTHNVILYRPPPEVGWV